MTEVFRPIPGTPTYQVSDHGNVLSPRGRILKRQYQTGGYLQVSLPIVRARLVHQLVLEAFVGPRPAGWVACIKDKENPTLENCYYAPCRYDGRNITRGRLTPAGILEIRQRKVMQAALAFQYGVCRQTIGRVQNGQAWAHV